MEAAFFCYYPFLIFWVPVIFPITHFTESILPSFLIQIINDFNNLNINT